MKRTKLDFLAEKKDINMSEIRSKIVGLQQFMNSKILGQEDLVDKLLITLLAEIGRAHV